MTLLAIVVPIAEIVVASAVADQVGWGATMAALLGLMLIGVLVIRGPQRWAWRAAAQPVAGGPPVAELSGRAIVQGVSGGLLIFPGFLTAAVGLLLVLPPVTHSAARYLARRFQEQVAAAGSTPPGATGYWRMTTTRRARTPGPTVVEGSVVRSDEADRQGQGPPGPAAGEIAAGPASDGVSGTTDAPGGPSASSEVVEGEIVEGEVVDGEVNDESPRESG